MLMADKPKIETKSLACLYFIRNGMLHLRNKGFTVFLIPLSSFTTDEYYADPILHIPSK
jgi:hypothetical protein